MVSFGSRNARHARTVDLHRVFVIRNEAVFAAAEIDHSLILIYAVQRTHVPIAVCYLFD